MAAQRALPAATAEQSAWAAGVCPAPAAGRSERLSDRLQRRLARLIIAAGHALDDGDTARLHAVRDRSEHLHRLILRAGHPETDRFAYLLATVGTVCDSALLALDDRR